MKRVFKISEAAAQSELLLNLHRHPSKPKTASPLLFTFPNFSLFRFYGDLGARTNQPPLPTAIPSNIISLFIEKLSQAEPQPKAREDLFRKVILFRDELVKSVDCLEEVNKALEEKGDWLLGSCKHYPALRTKNFHDSAFLELLKKLYSSGNLALEVCISIFPFFTRLFVSIYDGIYLGLCFLGFFISGVLFKCFVRSVSELHRRH